VIWRSFGKVSDKNEMPWLAIVVLTVPCYLMFLFQVWNGGTLASILGYLSSSLGLMFVVYYALTGVASAWMLRLVARKSVWTALTGVLLPLIGAGVLVWIGVKSWAGDAQDVRTTFIVAIALSLIAVIVSRFVGKSDFYRQRVTKPVAGVELAGVAGAAEA
jgi:FtsH-binding integral membrane protein